MKKSALFALVLALLIPFISYLIVKHYGMGAVKMPKRYFYDSVSIKNNGKTDTAWHKVKNMTFTNQIGKQVSLDDLKGKVLVVNFFFTRCPSICPGLTRSLKKLQDSYVKNPAIVQFLSISVDPEHDSFAVLRKYADKFNANHDTWWFLTGNKTDIYDFAIQEMKANIADPGIDTAFIHTEDFFLLDSNRIIRGWYNGFDTLKMAQLARDIPILMLEKDRSKSTFLTRFIPALPPIFVGIGIIILAMIFFKRSKNPIR